MAEKEAQKEAQKLFTRLRQAMTAFQSRCFFELAENASTLAFRQRDPDNGGSLLHEACRVLNFRAIQALVENTQQ